MPEKQKPLVVDAIAWLIDNVWSGSRDALASHLETSTSNISRWLNGHTLPSPRLRRVIMEHYQVEVAKKVAEAEAAEREAKAELKKRFWRFDQWWPHITPAERKAVLEWVEFGKPVPDPLVEHLSTILLRLKAGEK